MGQNLGNNYGKFYSFGSKPVLLDLNFVVDSTNGNGLGVRNVKGQGVKNVYMHTSATPAAGNPNPAVGYALIELSYNYARLYDLHAGISSPLTGSALAINGTALTTGLPYVITSVGHGSPGAATISPVADVNGSLAGTHFRLFDAYGNTFIIWFNVGGVGSPPPAKAGTLVQQSIATNSSAATIGAALVTTISTLPSGITGVYSFTATGTTTVTATSTNNLPLAGIPYDSPAYPTGFAFALTAYTPNLTNWQKVGVPAGVVPAIGVSFIATATGYSTGGGSTGTVQAVGVSGISTIELIGDPNQSIAPIPMGGSPNGGGYILLQFLAPTVSGSAYDTPMIPTAPANNSVVGMSLYLEQAARVGGNQE